MNQRGFTLIEIMMVLAIGGIIMPAVAATIFAVVQGSGRNDGTAVALADLDRAAHWLTRDLVLAQTTNLIDGAQPVPGAGLVLTWNDLTIWAQQEGLVSHSVSYTVSGTQLLRNYDGQVTTVSKYLTLVQFSISGRLLTMTLTSSPGIFIPRPRETRTYVIYLRAAPA